MKKILIASNGSGYQIDKCLEVPFFRASTEMVVSDRQCGALNIAQKHGIDCLDLSEKDSIRLNDKILGILLEREVDFIISAGFTRIFQGKLLNEYQNRLFNCHPSILPAFRGFYDTRDKKRTFHARKIFERTLDFGSRVTGNTIHVVAEEIDEGWPLIVSTMNIPYDEDVRFTRHRLFLQECKTLLQVVSWLKQDRLAFQDDGRPYITGAEFSDPGYSPNLEDDVVIEFDLKYPWW